MLPLKLADPMFNTKVSPEEIAAAQQVRALFQDFLKAQEVVRTHLDGFFEKLSETKDTSNLQRISPVLRKYIQKYRDICNDYIATLEKAVQYTASNFRDTDMTNTRDLIVESVKDVRNLSKDLILGFGNIDGEAFVQTVNEIYEKLSSRLDQIDSTVSDELFGHIDYNILGKIRLSSVNLPLSIKQSTGTKV